MPAGVEAVRSAERFYGGVLGLQRVPKPQPMAQRGGCWFKGPCLTLHLGVEEPFRPVRTAHPALVVGDLDGLLRRIRGAGGEVRVTDDQPGPPRAHAHDPFGNRIELIEACGPTPPMFQVMAEESIHPLALVDRHGVVRWIGRSVERFFGHPPETLIGKTFDHLIAPGSRQAAYQAFTRINDAHQPSPWGGVGMPVDLCRHDGTVVSCELAALTTHRSGLPWYVIVISQAGYQRALGQTVEAMASGASLDGMLPLLVEAIEHMMPRSRVTLGHDWSGQQFGLSAGATDLLVDQPGSPWAVALETCRDTFVDATDLPESLSRLAAAQGYASCWVHPVAPTPCVQPRSAIIVWRTHTGSPTELAWNPVRRAAQLLKLMLQWDHGRRSLEFAATHDALTGAVNRRAFRERLEALTADAGGQTAVLYVDLDYFKPINDRLGHPVGDRALTEIAGRLQGALRPGDLVARVGGDEFAVLCERLGAAEDAERVAARLLEVIRRPLNPHPNGPATEDLRLDASIGVVALSQGEPVDTLLGRADEAMRAAKNSGRGRWVRG